MKPVFSAAFKSACGLLTLSICLPVFLGGCAGGCGCKARQQAAQIAPVEKAAPAGGVRTGIEDRLNDVFFIARATLPPGAGAAGGTNDPVTAVESKVGFVVGNKNTILKTTDGGATWRRVLERKEDGPEFTGVTFVSVTQGWAVSQSVLLHTLDGGETWTSVPKPSGNFYYFGPFSATAGAYFQMQPPTCGATVNKTIDGGLTWTALPAHLPRNDYGAVFFYDDLHGWTAGGGGGMALTADGGATWRVQTLPAAGLISQIQFVTPLIGWAQVYADHTSLVCATTDGGGTWEKYRVPIESFRSIRDMQFLDEKTGFLLADAGDSRAQILRTTDGGATWQAVGAPQPDLVAISFIDAKRGWAAGGKGYIFRCEL